MDDGKTNSGCADVSSSFSWISAYLGRSQALWKPVSLFHVTYPADDIIGKILGWGSLIPMFIIVAFITLILFRRELHTMAFFGGIVLNELLNAILKHSIKASRPCRPGDEAQLFNKYGMPSSHAQFMGFFAIYMTLFAYIRLKMHISEQFMDNIRQHLMAFTSIGAALFVIISRIYLRYHTVEQVIVGLVIGVLSGVSWFFVVERFISNLFQRIVNTKVAEYFLIRDSSNIPDILWFEYTASRTESRQRTRRATQKSQ